MRRSSGWKQSGAFSGNQSIVDIGDIGGAIIRNRAGGMTTIDHISFGIEGFDPDKVEAELMKRGLGSPNAQNPGHLQPDTGGGGDIHTSQFKSYHTPDPFGVGSADQQHHEGESPRYLVVALVVPARQAVVGPNGRRAASERPGNTARNCRAVLPRLASVSASPVLAILRPSFRSSRANFFGACRAPSRRVRLRARAAPQCRRPRPRWYASRRHVLVRWHDRSLAEAGACLQREPRHYCRQYRQ